MPESLRIRVCVVALVKHHCDAIPNDLRQQLAGPDGDYDYAKIYGDASPDEWAPFEAERSILMYLKDAGFDPRSLSSILLGALGADEQDALVTQVDLYIIDPVFLTLTSYTNLMGRLAGAIRSGDKAFCIPRSSRLPPGLRERLEEICAQQLPLLKVAYEKDGIGEWEAEQPRRLLAYLKVLHRSGRSKQLLNLQGVPSIPMSQSPKFVGAFA